MGQKHSAAALSCFFSFDLPPVSGRRAGVEKARRVARMDPGQFAVSTRKCCQRTPEPARAVVRLHRTTDPTRAHLWPTFLCEQKGRAAGGSPAKRLSSLATVIPRRMAIPEFELGSLVAQSRASSTPQAKSRAQRKRRSFIPRDNRSSAVRIAVPSNRGARSRPRSACGRSERGCRSRVRLRRPFCRG